MGSWQLSHLGNLGLTTSMTKSNCSSLHTHTHTHTHTQNEIGYDWKENKITHLHSTINSWTRRANKPLMLSKTLSLFHSYILLSLHIISTCPLNSFSEVDFDYYSTVPSEAVRRKLPQTPTPSLTIYRYLHLHSVTFHLLSQMIHEYLLMAKGNSSTCELELLLLLLSRFSHVRLCATP